MLVANTKEKKQKKTRLVETFYLHATFDKSSLRSAATYPTQSLATPFMPRENLKTLRLMCWMTVHCLCYIWYIKHRAIYTYIRYILSCVSYVYLWAGDKPFKRFTLRFEELDDGQTARDKVTIAKVSYFQKQRMN